MEGSRPFLTEIGMESIQRGGNGLRARRSCPISLSRGLARKKKHVMIAGAQRWRLSQHGPSEDPPHLNPFC